MLNENGYVKLLSSIQIIGMQCMQHSENTWENIIAMLIENGYVIIVNMSAFNT
jgi:protein associated with RNAse G/E